MLPFEPYARDDSDAAREPYLLRVQAIRRLLESDDLKAIARGLRYFRAYEQERRKTLELELQLAKVGMEAMTSERLARMQLQAERQPQGVTPEQMNAEISRMVGELAASE